MKKFSLVLSVAVFIFVLLLSIATLCYFASPHSVYGTAIVGRGSVVSILPGGFDTLLTRDLLATASADPNDFHSLNVSFYKVPCQDVNYTYKELPIVSRPISPLFSNVFPFNYNYGDSGLYAVSGSTLVYVSIAKHSSEHDLSDCPLKLYLFDSISKYINFKNNPELEGYIASSNCLPAASGGEPSIYITNFTLKADSFYYVGAYVESGVTVRMNISGNIIQYSLQHSQREKCFLNSHNNQCSISIAQADVATQQNRLCVFTYSPYNSPLSVNYTTSSTGIHNVGSVTSLTAMLFFVIVLVCLGIIIFCKVAILKPITRQQETLPINTNIDDYSSI